MQDKVDLSKPVSLYRAEEIVKRSVQNFEAVGTPQANAMRQLSLVLLALVQSQQRIERDLEMTTKRVAVLVNHAGIDERSWSVNPTPE